MSQRKTTSKSNGDAAADILYWIENLHFQLEKKQNSLWNRHRAWTRRRHRSAKSMTS